MPENPKFTAADYARALSALLPRGRAWPRAKGSVQEAVCAALAPTVERNDARAMQLLSDVFPGSTLELLPEWEESLGLPDPCAGVQPSTEQRRAQVVARLASVGGQTDGYFVQYAANLGYQITLTEFTDFKFGETFGEAINSSDWAYALQVNSPLNSVTSFEFGVGAFGDAFANWGNAVLECELAKIMPAHMVHIFSYT